MREPRGDGRFLLLVCGGGRSPSKRHECWHRLLLEEVDHESVDQVGLFHHEGVRGSGHNASSEFGIAPYSAALCSTVIMSSSPASARVGALIRAKLRR